MTMGERIKQLRSSNGFTQEMLAKIIRIEKSEFVERFSELSLFYRLFSPLDSEMICIFPYFCPCEIIVREIREISFSHCLPPCREALLNHA